MTSSSQNYFYESGYNAVAWSAAQSFETDIFYFHINDLPNADSLKTELQKAIDFICKENSVVLLDDQSLESQIIKKLAPTSLKIQPWPQNFEIDLKLSKKWKENYSLQDPEAHLILQFAKRINTPVIVPRAWLRIINTNWQHSQQKSLGLPYWVYVENERSHLFELVQQAEGLRIHSNIFKWSAKVFRSYFENQNLIHFLQNQKEPPADNYAMERTMLVQLYKELDGDLKSLNKTDKIHWPIPQELSQLFSPQPLQQAAFPLQHFYQKYFSKKIPINKLERHLYQGFDL